MKRSDAVIAIVLSALLIWLICEFVITIREIGRKNKPESQITLPLPCTSDGIYYDTVSKKSYYFNCTNGSWVQIREDELWIPTNGAKSVTRTERMRLNKKTGAFEVVK